MIFDLIIFISGAWPGKHKGYEIANLATLEYFSLRTKHCFYFGPSEDIIADETYNRFPNCSFFPANFNRKPKSVRFLKTVFSEYPAITERFWGESEDIISKIEKEKNTANKKTLFFYEDIPAAYLMLDLKNKYQDSQHFVRSHNVVYKGFYGLINQGNPVMDLLWTHEVKRIRDFEKRVFNVSDAFFSISEDDSDYYRENMQILPDGNIGFFLDDSYFDGNSSSADNNLIFLGTADLRKGRGLKNFIEITWPIIRRNHPDVKFFIGGRNTESFHDPESGIHAFGFIQDEQSFMEKGNIFINPQTEGAGIKIKNVVALSKNKTLVTTSVGAEGIGVRNNVHCIIEDDFEKQASIISRLIEDGNQQQKLATAGYHYVNSAFSKDTYFEHMDSLFKS